VYFRKEEELDETIKKANKSDTLFVFSKCNQEIGKYKKYSLTAYTKDKDNDKALINQLFSKNVEEEVKDENLSIHFEKEFIPEFAKFLKKRESDEDEDKNNKYVVRMQQTIESANLSTFELIKGKENYILLYR
jgi:hypothetical protein